MTDSPRISVLISTYRNARFVSKKLAEIRAQSWFQHAEFLFIETASPENERELLAPFCAQYTNCRLITTEERKTLYGAWNLGWSTARAPLICYSNMDDAMHPRLLEAVVIDFERRHWDVASVLIAEQQADDARLNEWSLKRLQRLRLNARPGPFTAWRRDLERSVGMFDPEFTGAGDLDFWSRVQSKGRRLRLIPKVLYLYTKSPQQLSKSNEANRAADRERLAGKAFPIGWPRQFRWRVYLFREVLRRWPNLVCAPVS